MSNRIVYMHGAYVSEAEAKLSIYDLSVMQGAAAFEMTRSFRGIHFKLPEHLARLQQSCKLLGIPLPADFARLPDICAEVTARNVFAPDDEHRLLIVVSPGCAPMYRGFAGAVGEPWLYVADFPLRHTVQGMGRQFTEGGTAIVSKVYQVPRDCIPPQAKHRSRLHFHLAQAEAVTAGSDWAFMAAEVARPEGPEDLITECPGANIFAVRRGELVTDLRHSLRGISAEYVLRLAKKLKVKSCEFVLPGPYRMAKECKEIFVTGTPFCMLPIVKVDGLKVGDGTPGPIYRRLLAAWSELVCVDIAEQIIQWDLAA